MELKLRDHYQWAMLTMTSMGIRITPANRQPVHTADLFSLQVTSAESNVVSIASSLGMPVKVLTATVKDSPIAARIKSDLQSRGITLECVERTQDGPWGYRHQFNIADAGFGVRGPRVQNDRAGEVGRTLGAGSFDAARIFGQEGVGILHLSGLVAALSPETGGLCLELARAAKENGTLVSFDLNHRASFWKDREQELHAIFGEIAGLSDILVGNEEDFQLALGIKGPEAGGKAVDEIESFKDMMRRVRQAFPRAKVFANTLRQVENANLHRWGAILCAGDEWFVEPPREIPVLDRIGGGDGFVGGLLYGILKGWPCGKWLQFGWAAGALVVTLETDYALPADEEQVWSIYAGNARVRR